MLRRSLIKNLTQKPFSPSFGRKFSLQTTSKQSNMPLIPGSSGQPRVILGLMTFGTDTNAGARITDLGEYNKCLDYLQSHGYNELDSARTYIAGKQESFSRDAKWKERGFTMATKCYPVPNMAPGQTSHKPEELRKCLETSLQELGTDCVDIFYLHAADRSTPFEDTLREVDKMHKEGKFVTFALSNFTAFELAEVVMTCKANGWVRPTIYQGMYNAITRSLDAELIPACRRYGLDVVVYNPIAGGLFSGKYSAASLKEGAPSEGRFSDSVGRMGGQYRARYFKDATFDALALIEPVVKKHNLTMLETALRWCVHHSKLRLANTENGEKGNDGIIIGVSSLQQLEGNLKDLEKGPLPEEVVKTLDDAWLITKGTTPNYWHLNLEYTYDTQKSLFGKI